MDNTRKPRFKYEYEHYVMAPGVHYGRHSIFGPHIAVGDGPNSFHVYPSKIYIGGRTGTSINLTPEQMRIVARILNKVDQRSGTYKKLEDVKENKEVQ